MLNIAQRSGEGCSKSLSKGPGIKLYDLQALFWSFIMWVTLITVLLYWEESAPFHIPIAAIWQGKVDNVVECFATERNKIKERAYFTLEVSN